MKDFGDHVNLGNAVLLTSLAPKCFREGQHEGPPKTGAPPWKVCQYSKQEKCSKVWIWRLQWCPRDDVMKGTEVH